MGDWPVALFLGLLAAGWLARPQTWRLRRMKGEAELMALLPDPSEARQRLAAYLDDRVQTYVSEATRPSRRWVVFERIAWTLLALEISLWVIALLTVDSGADTDASDWWVLPWLIPPALYWIVIVHDFVAFIRGRRDLRAGEPGKA